MQNIENKILKIADDFDNGDINSLDAFIQVREIKKNIDSLLDNIKGFEDFIQDSVANECQNYPNGYNGFKISVMAGRKLWSYKGINVVEEKEKEIKEIKKGLEGLFNKGKGITEIEGVYYFKDEEGLIQLPMLNYSKSFLKLEKIKTK